MHLESTLKKTKESALKQELSTLRKFVKVWYVFNDGYPRDLRALFMRDSTLFGSTPPNFNPELLNSMTTDDVGYPIDPFGNRYMYDPTDGKITCVSPGYDYL